MTVIRSKPVLLPASRETLSFTQDGSYVKVTRTGTEYSVTIDWTAFDDWRNKGMLIQRAIPNLDKGQREFLISGYTPQEWDELFAEEEE